MFLNRIISYICIVKLKTKFKINMKTSKEQAIERLTEIENETKALRKIIENGDEPKNIMERVKTYEDACKVLGKDAVKELPYKNPSSNYEKYKNAEAKIEIIIEALNEGWFPYVFNTSEYKYYPYFKVSGSGLAYVGCGYAGTRADFGARRVLKTSALAEYAGTHFIAEYTDYNTLH